MPRSKRPLIIDYAAIPHHAGPGPWIVLKGRLDPGPDPSSVHAYNTTRDDLIGDLKILWSIERRIAEMQPAKSTSMKPGVRIYFGVGLYIYRHIQSRNPDLEHNFLHEISITDVADRIICCLNQQIGAGDPEAN